MKIGVVTSNHPRHFAFLQEFPRPSRNPNFHFFIEPKEGKPSQSERKFFSDMIMATKEKVHVTKGSGADRNKWIEENEFDFLFVFGASIIPGKTLNHVKHEAINLHTGLTTWHRGVEAHIRMLAADKPYLLGCTYHRMTPGIDTGAVFHRVLFDDWRKGDNLNKIFWRNCKIGIEALPIVLADVLNGDLKPLPYLDYMKGSLIQNKDVTASLVTQAEANLKTLQSKL